MEEGQRDGEWLYHRGKGTERSFYLPRLPREHYLGDAAVHWTLPIAERRVGWLTDSFHSAFREMMLHAQCRQSLHCPAYCLMPDHIHLVWMGLQLASNQLQGMKFLREHLGPHLHPYRFQHQAHDHVLKEHERKRGAFAKACEYVLENPVRAGLINPGETWGYQGAVVPGYPRLDPAASDCWAMFWRIHLKERAHDAGNLIRPPVGRSI